MNLLVLLFLVPIMLGVYFVTLGIWELREGRDKKRYIKFMFSGLILIIIAPIILLVFGISVFSLIEQLN